MILPEIGILGLGYLGQMLFRQFPWKKHRGQRHCRKRQYQPGPVIKLNLSILIGTIDQPGTAFPMKYKILSSPFRPYWKTVYWKKKEWKSGADG